VLLLGIALGVAVYIGVPLGYRGLVEPSQVNADRIEVVQNDLEQNRSAAESLRAMTGERLANFEANQVGQGEKLAELQATLEALRADLADQADDLSSVNTQLDILTTAVSGLEEQLTLAVEDSDDGDIRRELMISRSMLYLVRARLWLLENNIGLARGEILRARGLLAEADAAGELESVQAAIARLDFALEELNTTPLVAADDIEIAWKLLVGAEIEGTPAEAEE
jgi:seryl-tRNA synthetase